ncbi:terminase large subunit [Octadecabacter Antarctic BD virus 1]|nr:terminase large subunit [Octadecabacter Antarctic BD virus 1]
MAKAGLSNVELTQLAEMCAKCRHDPLLWAETAWDWGHGELKDKDIRVWQADILGEITDHLADPATRYQPLKISVASGHGIGKSAEMGIVSNWAMSCHRGARVVITANTEGQLRTKTSPEIAKWFSTSVSAPLFEIDTLSIKAKQSTKDVAWAMDFTPWSEHNTEAFAGLHNEGRIILLLMDEASGIAQKIWEVAEGALTDENTIIIWIAFGNPTQNNGEFRECFRRNRDDWITKQICSLDVEGVNRTYIQKIVDKYGWNSDRVKVRVRGMFPSSSTRQMIPTHVIDAAYGRHLRKSEYDFAPVILTCDPAWTGADDLVIAKRQGLHFEILDVIPKNDNDIFIATKIARYEDRYEADAVFVDLGYGTGIVSAGRTWGRTWELIPFGGGSPEAGFADMRAFMYDTAQTWMEQGGAIPEDDELYMELQSIETLPDNNGIVRLMSKEQMKKKDATAVSPNKADALVLSFARPVVKKRHKQTEDEPYLSVTRNNSSRYTNSDGEYDTGA